MQWKTTIEKTWCRLTHRSLNKHCLKKYILQTLYNMVHKFIPKKAREFLYLRKKFQVKIAWCFFLCLTQIFYAMSALTL